MTTGETVGGAVARSITAKVKHTQLVFTPLAIIRKNVVCMGINYMKIELMYKRSFLWLVLLGSTGKRKGCFSVSFQV